MAVDRQAVEQFLYREARLMDESRYEEWEALWADDGVYWVPCNDDDSDPNNQVSIIYDDRTRIHQRIARLLSGQAHVQEPRSRLRRTIGNVEIEARADGEIAVHSNFVLVEYRNEQRLWAGRTTHRLRTVPSGFQLVFKKVALVNNDAELPALGFLI
jgi:3-phenylpropionate/cinnamic acid dioxygenase small subunit